MLNPPFHRKYSRSQRSPGVIKSGVIYYPIWLAYATGVLEQSGFESKLVDAPAAGMDLADVLELVDSFQPRLVVVDTSTPSIHNDIKVAAAIKNASPNRFVLLVGPHVSALPEITLKSSQSVDAVARHEYDYTVRQLAQSLVDGGDLEKIQGLSYRTPGGAVIHNKNRPLIQNLDDLPFVSDVYRRHLRIEDYFYSITRYPSIAVVAGRGCPHACAFCLWPQTLTGNTYRRRSATNVADEFEFIARYLPNVKEIFLEDDTLTVNRKYSISLAEELIRRGNGLPFTANSRADVHYDALQHLKQAGLRLLCVGFESGDQSILDGVNKGIKIDQFYRFRDDARRAGVLIHGCFMAGNPGETRESLEKTLSLAKQLDPDTAQFFPLMVYPGTKGYDLALQDGLLETNDFQEWLTPNGLHRTVVSQANLSADEITAWCNYARRSFYLRPRYIASKIQQAVTHPGEARRLFRAGRSFARHLFR